MSTTSVKLLLISTVLWMAFFVLLISFPPFLSMFSRGQLKSPPSTRSEFTYRRPEDFGHWELG